MATETFKNSYKTNVAVDSFDTAYTTPIGTTALIISSQIANKTSTDVVVTVRWHDSSADVDVVLGSSLLVPANTVLEPLAGRLILETGDYIEVSQIGGAANSLDISLSVLEIV
jgi:hypothetical protein